MIDYSKKFDEVRYREKLNIDGYELNGFRKGVDWAKPMLMEAIEALEKISNADKQLTPSPNPYYIANETLVSIREKLGVEG